MTRDIIDALVDIDWEKDCVWVQIITILEIVEQVGQSLRLRRSDGSELWMRCDEARRSHYPIDEGASLKPRYDPVKAYLVGSTADVAIAGGVTQVSAGDALLRDDDDRIVVVAAREFRRDYQAVAYPGTIQRPELPFPDLK